MTTLGLTEPPAWEPDEDPAPDDAGSAAQHYQPSDAPISTESAWSASDYANTPRGAVELSPRARRAYSLSVIYRGVSLVANTMAVIPCSVKRMLPDDAGAEPLPKHRTTRLLTRRPNRWQTAFAFRQMITGHQILRGNAYAGIVSSRDGWATELIPLHPDRMQPYEVTEDGLLYYYQPPYGQGGFLLENVDVIHWRGLSDDGYTGLSLLSLMRRATETTTNMEEFGRRFFRQAPAMRGVLRYPGTMDPKIRRETERSFVRSTSGQRGWFYPPVLEGGLEWQSIGVNNSDSQWLDARHFSVPDLARFLGVPLVLLMHTDKSAVYANAAKFFDAFASFDLTAWIASFEQRCTRTLLTPEEQDDDDLYVDLDIRGMLRGDPVARANYYRAMIELRLLTRNEVRRMEGHNRMDGLDEFDPQPGAAKPPGEPPAAAEDDDDMPPRRKLPDEGDDD